MPQLHHAEPGGEAAHITDQLQFCLCVLIRMTVGTPRLTGQRFYRSIPANSPEVDVRTVLVVLFPTGMADAVFLSVFHQGLPICHVLCYILAHEGYGLSRSVVARNFDYKLMRPFSSSFFVHLSNMYCNPTIFFGYSDKIKLNRGMEFTFTIH